MFRGPRPWLSHLISAGLISTSELLVAEHAGARCTATFNTDGDITVDGHPGPVATLNQAVAPVTTTKTGGSQFWSEQLSAPYLLDGYVEHETAFESRQETTLHDVTEFVLSRLEPDEEITVEEPAARLEVPDVYALGLFVEHARAQGAVWVRGSGPTALVRRA